MATRRGPKPLYSKELADDVLGGLSIGLTAADAIAATGVSQDTVDRWRQGKSGAPAEFAEHYARARVAGIRRRIRRLVQLADDGDVRAIEAWLDRCAPAYRKTAGVDVTHRGTVTHEHALLDAAVKAIAEETGLDVDEVKAEADAIVAGAQR